ncbi:cytochrome P450 [Ramicandelaber brevisporus]|nr:cytochrome P450 [Ramicandelaber brevisporus]
MAVSSLVVYFAGGAVALAALWLALRTPPQLAHLPQLSFLDLIRILTQQRTAKLVNDATAAIVRNPDIHVQYGLGEYMVVVKNPVLIKETFDKAYIFDKYDPVENAPDSLAGKAGGDNIAFVRTSGTWKMHRRIINPAFTRGYDVNIFGDCAKLAIHRILELKPASKNERVLEVWPLMSEVTLNALGRFAFGTKVGSLGERFLKLFAVFIKDVFEPVYIMLPGIDKPWNPYRRHAFENWNELESIVYQMVESKRNEAREAGGFDKIENPDILTYLKLSAAMLRGDLMAILTAGSDTSSSALNSAIFQLAKHPDIQAKARQHVFDILGDAAEDIVPSAEEQKQLTYLTQIIKESTRLTPPLLQAVFRRVNEDYQLGEHFIPKDTLLIQNLWMAHRHPDFWGDNPLEFNPDRFAGDAKDVFWSAEHPGWLSFGYGLRGCMGMQFALMEMRIVLAMLLRRFEWRLADGHPGTLELTASVFPRVITNQVAFSPRY